MVDDDVTPVEEIEDADAVNTEYGDANDWRM